MFLKYATALATMAISSVVHAYPSSWSGDVSAAVAGASFGKYNREFDYKKIPFHLTNFSIFLLFFRKHGSFQLRGLTLVQMCLSLGQRPIPWF